MNTHTKRYLSVTQENAICFIKQTKWINETDTANSTLTEKQRALNISNKRLQFISILIIKSHELYTQLISHGTRNKTFLMSKANILAELMWGNPVNMYVENLS